MSLKRFVYYSAVIGGWAALLGWAGAELVLWLLGSPSGLPRVTLFGALVGAAIGAGLNVVSGLANAKWQRMLLRSLPGLLGGAVGGAIGGVLGDAIYAAAGFPRAVGWMIMGLAIGAAEGVYERSPSKLRNGLIGGAAGGLLGGLLFDPIFRLTASGSGTSSRATAFVILGVFIGAGIGLTHVVLKRAWLTVLDGFRPGRQLILSEKVTVLGRGDHLPLPFLGYAARDLESEHLRITLQPGGQYVIEDSQSRTGTRVNGKLIESVITLNDGDVIKLGSNLVRFNRARRGWGLGARGQGNPFSSLVPRPSSLAPSLPPPPPPPVARPPTPEGTPRPQVPRPAPDPPDFAPRLPPPPPPPPAQRG